MLLETAFRAITSGFYGALIQAIRKLKPAWLAVLIIVVIAPAAVQGLEYLVHWLRGTPHLTTGLWVSGIVTAIACLFNWYAMLNGTLLTGKEGQSLWTDVQRLPGLIGGFLTTGPLAVWRLFSRANSEMHRGA